MNNIEEYDIHIKTKEDGSAVIEIKTERSNIVFEIIDVDSKITFDTEQNKDRLMAYLQKEINLSISGNLVSTTITV